MLSTTRGAQGLHVTSQVSKRLPPNARDVRVDVQELRGGLISQSVVQVSARYVSQTGHPEMTRFVLKRLDGDAVREARVYEGLLALKARDLAPLLYGVDRPESGPTHLCLEAVPGVGGWPWKNIGLAGAVLERITTLHELPSAELAQHDLHDWNYDAELERTAKATLETALGFRGSTGSSALERSLPALRRIAENLPAIRSELSRFDALPPTIIHGDLHPGNVLVRTRGGVPQPVLLDWARARVGSPLEDVASWLQWLGFWEPEVRRKHDTLLGTYLVARGLPRVPSTELRNAYWLAGALNCYAGVMNYYFAVAGEREPDDPEREAALRAVHDCLRVIRRADAYFRR